MINALIYPSAPNAGIPHSFGFISVVQIILELIRSAITHSPITIFRTSLRSSLERSSATWRSRLIFVCPFIQPCRKSAASDGTSMDFLKDR